MHKLPKVFSKYFLKEGVVHAVQQLAATAPKPAAEEKKAQGKAAKRASQRLKVRAALVPVSPALCVAHIHHCMFVHKEYSNQLAKGDVQNKQQHQHTDTCLS